MTSNFCPIIKEKCKTDECMAWRDDKCLIFSFLEMSDTLPYRELAEIEDDLEFRYEPERREVPAHIKSSTPEELAAELVSFAKREFAHEERIWISRVAGFYWEQKGISKWEMPSDIRLKLEKAELLAQQQIDKEREAELKEQLDKEKTQLPELVSQCVSWARKQGLTRLTHADIDAFLLEQGIEILSQTKRALYSMANLKLKTKR